MGKKKGNTYVVGSGDSWASIAGDIYGNQRMFVELLRANPGIDMLHPGMVISLPKAKANEDIYVPSGLAVQGTGGDYDVFYAGEFDRAGKLLRSNMASFSAAQVPGIRTGSILSGPGSAPLAGAGQQQGPPGPTGQVAPTYTPTQATQGVGGTPVPPPGPGQNFGGGPQFIPKPPAPGSAFAPPTPGAPAPVHPTLGNQFAAPKSFAAGYTAPQPRAGTPASVHPQQGNQFAAPRSFAQEYIPPAPPQSAGSPYDVPASLSVEQQVSNALGALQYGQANGVPVAISDAAAAYLVANGILAPGALAQLGQGGGDVRIVGHLNYYYDQSTRYGGGGGRYNPRPQGRIRRSQLRQSFMGGGGYIGLVSWRV